MALGTVGCKDDKVAPDDAPREMGDGDGDQHGDGDADQLGDGDGDDLVPTQCASDAECDSGRPVCDVREGCVACQFDDDCEEGARCVDFQCEDNIVCTSNNDCEGSPFPACDAESGTCRECVDHSHCGAGRRCNDENHCVDIVACIDSSDCQEGTVCSRTEGICVTCLADADCGEGKVCEESACISACQSNADCGDERVVCDTARGHCVECLVGDDCGEDYFCDGGVCELDACVAGETSCDGESNSVLQCLADGSAQVAVFCPTGTTCRNGDGGAHCRPWVCNPGQTTCDPLANTLSTCDESGLNTASSVDCTESGGRCENLACAEVTCEPGTNFCVSGDSYLCNGLGTAFSLSEDCGTGFNCNTESGLCEINVCAPNSTSCEGDVVKTCNSIGSGFLEANVDCTEAEQVCMNGACAPVVCDFVSRCNGTIRELCQSRGTLITGVECTSSYHCLEAEGTASCAFDICTQSTTSCQGDVLSTCNADGSAWLSQLDCAAENLTCSVSGCLAELGGTATTYLYNLDGYFYANNFLATENDVLVRFQQYMNTYTSTSLSWAVYEADTQFGDYTRLALYQMSAASTSGIWHESPLLNVPLTAGKYYLVGVRVANSDYAYYGPLTATAGSMTPLGRYHALDASTALPDPRPVASLVDTTTVFRQRLVFQ